MKIFLKGDALPFWLGIIKARINEGINKVTLVELELASRDELKPEDLDGLIGKPVTLHIEDIIGSSLHTSRLDGVIFEMTDVTGGKAVQGVYYYTMVVRPPLWKLNYFVHSRSFTDTTRIEVIDDLLKEHGLARGEHYTTNYRSEKVYPPFRQILQTGNSDLSFFEDTLSNAGINYYFAADEDAEKPEQLHLVDDNAFFAPYEETIPIVDAAGMVHDERRVEHIARLTRAVPGSVTSTAFLGEGSVVSKKSSETIEGGSTDGQVHVYVPEGGQDRSGVAKQAGKIKAEGFSAQRVVHRGVSDHIRIRPGRRVTLRSFATAREYGILITEVRHTFEQTVPAALDEDASNEPAYKNHFTAAQPLSPVRPAQVTSEVDIDFALDTALDLDLNGKVSIDPKFEMNNEFNFNPSFNPEINTKGIGMLLAAVAGLQVQVSSLKRQIASMKSATTAGDNGGMMSGVVQGPGQPINEELTCIVKLDGVEEPITAKVMALWHTQQGGLHFLPRAGNHVWVQKIAGARGNDWVVVGYRPSLKVPIANAPSGSTTIKGLRPEGAPAWEASTASVVSPSNTSVSNYNRLGIMGENNVAEMFIADGEGHVVSRANKNIYQQCDEDLHVRCKNMMSDVSETASLQYGDVHRLVTGDQNECIGGNKELSVGGEHKISAGGKQTIHALDGQDVEVTNGQKITVTSGNREITVANGDLKETVNGSETRSITKDKKRFVGGKWEWLNVGDNYSVWAGMENGLTMGEKTGVWLGVKAEADLLASEKLNAGGFTEQTFGYKHSTTIGYVREFNKGPRKSNEMLAKTTLDVSLSISTLIAEQKTKMGKLTAISNNISAKITMFK